jgi:hypothetical protein
MKWTKASQFKYEDRKVYFAKRTGYSQFKKGEDTIIGTGYFNDDVFWWKENGFVPVMQRSFIELEILDETPEPLTTPDEQALEKEAEMRYPIDKRFASRVEEWTEGSIVEQERSAYIEGRRRSMARIKELEELLKNIYEMYGEEWTDYAREWTEKVLRINPQIKQ